MSHTIVSGTPVDAVLNSLHNSSGLCVNLLSLTCELDFVEGEKPTANAPGSAEIIEGIFEACKPEFLLAVDNTSQTDCVLVLCI